MPGQSVRRLTTLIGQLKNLNFYGDRDLDQVMEQVQSIIDQPARERQLGDIRRQLRAIALVTRSTLMQLGETPRSARGVDVPDVVSDVDMREARMELQLEQSVMVADEGPRGARQEDSDIGNISGEIRMSRSE